MKNTYCLLVLFVVFVCKAAETSAQSFDEYKRQQQAKYNSYKTKKTEEYRAYRDRVNAEYADYMRRAWTREEAQSALPVPKRPEPPTPVIRKPMDMPKFGAVPFGEVQDLKLPKLPKPEPIVPIEILEEPVSLEEPVEEPVEEPATEPVEEPMTEPVKEPDESKMEGFTFKWCGLMWNVPLEEKHRFRLHSTKEADVAEAWENLSGAKYAPVVAACLKVRNTYLLPDWGYLRFLDAMADAFLPGMPSEARLLEMFILVQSGYQARIARADGRLYLLVPSSGDIFEYTYLKMGGRKYYVTDKRSKGGSFYVFEREFPREQPLVWQMRKLPQLSSECVFRTLQSKRYPEVRATVGVSRGLVEFMNDYPRCNNWDCYALASLSEQVKKGLYPSLLQRIEGKNKIEAVDVLLDFVQTAFEYKTDAEQFGTERPLFGDETFFYPYSDCEDRAILFSILVRELVGLDVVLLNYPDHLATAVCVGDDVVGDYFELEGARYVVCDPTFIGSHVGESMPQYKNIAATVVRI